MKDNKKIVTKISANPLLQKQINKDAFLRVAAYCRVSTDSEDQLESYKAQVKYYTDVINKNPRWRFVDIYADEGISGTRTTKRINFNRMIKDCEKGKIDMILTKSVARFARNTVDSLNYVRKLKAMGIGVFFEEQNLDSLKADSEMFIGLHSVLAQAESENISANVRWGVQQRMKAGTFKFRYNILGYKKGDDGEPEIVENEAEIIREIYKLYLDGLSLCQIKNHLENKGYRTTQGLVNWTTTRIKSILTNERYCGDLLMQKTYIDNCITKKHKKNRGELPKYYIKDNHPAIVEREIFNKVQVEISRRGTIRKKSTRSTIEKGKYSGRYALTHLLVCGECGSPYRRRMWLRKNGEKIVWRCINRIENGVEYCDNIAVEEVALQNAISRGLKKIFSAKDEVIESLKNGCNYLLSGKEEYMFISSAEQQIGEYKQLIDKAVELMIKTTGDKKRYENDISMLNNKITVLEDKIKIEREKISNNTDIKSEINLLENIMESYPKIKNGNEYILNRIINSIRVMKDKKIIIQLKGGYQIEEIL